MNSSRQQDASITDLPIEVFANILVFLSPAEISRLLRSNREFQSLIDRKELFDTLLLLVKQQNIKSQAPLIPQSEHSAALFKQFVLLPAERKKQVTMKQFFKKASVDNLDGAIFQVEGEDMWLQPRDVETKSRSRVRIILLSILIALTFSASNLLLRYFTNLHVDAIWVSLGITAGVTFIGVALSCIPKIKQCLFQTQKDKVAEELENGLSLDTTTPLLAAMKDRSSYTEPAPSPVVKEIFYDAIEGQEQERELKEVVSDTSPIIEEEIDLESYLPSVPKHPVTQKGSLTLYTVKVEGESISQESDRDKKISMEQGM